MIEKLINREQFNQLIEDHHMPPIIKSQTHEIFKKENDNVTFHCATESISESVTFWYKVVNDSVKNEIPVKRYFFFLLKFMNDKIIKLQ